MANLVTFVKKLWKDATSGGTPITAAELNRIEDGINNCATQINNLGDSVSRLTVKVKTVTGTTSANGNFSFDLPHGSIVLYAQCKAYEGGQPTSVICVPYGYNRECVGCACYLDIENSKILSKNLTVIVYYLSAE